MIAEGSIGAACTHDANENPHHGCRAVVRERRSGGEVRRCRMHHELDVILTQGARTADGRWWTDCEASLPTRYEHADGRSHATGAPPAISALSERITSIPRRGLQRGPRRRRDHRTAAGGGAIPPAHRGRPPPPSSPPRLLAGPQRAARHIGHRTPNRQSSRCGGDSRTRRPHRSRAPPATGEQRSTDTIGRCPSLPARTAGNHSPANFKESRCRPLPRRSRATALPRLGCPREPTPSAPRRE